MFDIKKVYVDWKQKRRNSKIKVIVGLSGGIDSAYTAYLLKSQGYHVEAFYMRNWDTVKNNELNNILTEDEICTQTEDREDAILVANFLDIPFHEVNLVEEYWDLVFEKFLEDLRNGITPNPDILCNRYIKFDKFIEKIENEIGEFDFIATGHYAQIMEKNDKYYMTRPIDETKDQTYFLAEVRKEILNKIMFPLANINKKEIRENAIKLNLPVATKKDSTGICFIGERNFPKFVSNYIQEKEGNIINIETNEIIGTHKGVYYYTLGQRKGLNLGGQKEPLFVVKKDLENNIVYVGTENNDLLFSNKITANQFNLLVDKDDFTNLTSDLIQIKVRHSIETHEAKLLNYNFETNTIEIELSNKIKAVTPGQELVIYKDEIVIGGGQII